MNKRLKRLIIFFIAQSAFQPFFEKLFWISLKGMNYGAANSPKYSGEEWVIRFLKKIFGDKKIHIVDVGANEGQYASLIRKYFEDNIIYYGFEPSSSAYSSLSKKNFPESYFFVNAGLSDKTEKSNLYFSESGSVQASLYTDKSTTKKEEITLLTLDDFLSKKQLSQIDFLKIDVEGHELEVLIGSQNHIKDGRIGIIQFEFGSQHILSRTFLKDFLKILPEYSIYRILQNGIYKVKQSPLSEIFFTSNYLAIHNSLITKHNIKY